MGGQVTGAHSLEGDARAHGGLGEDHGHGEASKRLVALIPVLQLLLHLQPRIPVSWGRQPIQVSPLLGLLAHQRGTWQSPEGRALQWLLLCAEA